MVVSETEREIRRIAPLEFPAKFLAQYEALIEDSEALFVTLRKPLMPSFRVNRLKSNPAEIKQRFAGYGIPIRQTEWYEDAFICPDVDPSPTFEHFMGKIYLQELTSMLPPLVVKDELKCAKFALETCAAPGSKATQIGSIMRNNGMFYANDVDAQRIRGLKHNLAKSGVCNVVITHSDFGGFVEPKEKLDVIVVDAPCSSDGTIRKSPGLLRSWREGRAYKYAKLQRHILKRAYQLLREGGVLVYSTCSLSPIENEMIVEDLLKEFPAQIEPFEIPGFKLRAGLKLFGASNFSEQITNTRRVWPQDNDTGGFYLARIRKPEQ